MKMDPAFNYRAAWTDYAGVLRELIKSYPAPDLLELGGGRNPRFKLSDLPDNVASYTVNDISQAELALLPDGYDEACFDAGGDVSAFRGKYDVVFSHFMCEHIEDGGALHKNVYEILKPGGVAFHLLPTLFASPFLVNTILPEKLATDLVTKLFPYRSTLHPKFPAYYSYCRSDSKKMRELFSSAGYRNVEFRHFYGHEYYARIPVLREIENYVSNLACKNDWTWYTSYAFITAYK